MRLATKLFIMSFFTILIPMLIIVLFSVFTIYQTNAISQWEYLETVERNIYEDIEETETDYLKEVKSVAGNRLVSDKLYVYRKYWKMLTDSLIAYDLESLSSYIYDFGRDEDIEAITVYRRDGDDFYPVISTGGTEYQAEFLSRETAQKTYGRAVYTRRSDGIYLSVIYPVFSEGNLVGLIQFMRGFNDVFLADYVETYRAGFSLVSGGDVLLTTVAGSEPSVRQLLAGAGDETRLRFRSGSATYWAVVLPFSLGGNADGSLVTFIERSDIFGDESGLIMRLIAMTLLCILIPVAAFFIKEIRLIRSINSLLDATGAITAGDYSGRVGVHSRDELGMLSRNFNEMVSVLQKNRNELESRNSELALKNSYIDAVFQSLRINIIVLDPEMRIQVISRNAGSRLELTEQHTGCGLLELDLFASERELLRQTLDEVYQRRKFTRLYSVKFGITSYEMDFYPVIESGDRIGAVVIVMNNITERMNMENALIQSDRLASVGELAAGLAHEINNPMSIILNHVQLMKTDKLGPEDRVRFTGRVESEIKRVSKLINNLLKFSRDETVQHERISLGDMFSEVIGLIDPAARSERVAEFYDGHRIQAVEADCYRISFRDKRLEFFLSGDLVDASIVTGRNCLKQVLFNIIKNALESIEEAGGILWAGIEGAEGMTRIFLADNGCGISSEELLKVFELFYTRGKAGSGVGLGLPLCRKLMNSAGGEISIESEPESGTRVVLMFPDREEFYG